MSIYIRGIGMPKACVYRENGHFTTCPLYDIDGYCGALNTQASHNEGEKLSDCPLFPVPPHGDLIDRGKYKQEMSDCRMAFWDEVLDSIPTIIPADKEGEG